ncbi:hypothetical protein J6590_039892 [Homalodisca vitripennis]|nr:hypothetical protein J6590_039892 [Homalodisca vitripennis]
MRTSGFRFCPFGASTGENDELESRKGSQPSQASIVLYHFCYSDDAMMYRPSRCPPSDSYSSGESRKFPLLTSMSIQTTPLRLALWTRTRCGRSMCFTPVSLPHQHVYTDGPATTSAVDSDSVR